MRNISKTNDELNQDLGFGFSAHLIQLVSFAIALLSVAVSRYAFIFFSAAMLPTIIAIFFDRKSHKCASATVCTFNLIGVMPYLIQIWEAQSINSMAKLIIADTDTWVTIYVTALLGQLLYVLLPLLVVKIYSARSVLRAGILEQKKLKIMEEWGIQYNKTQENVSTQDKDEELETSGEDKVGLKTR
jgi:hypothetical protein